MDPRLKYPLPNNIEEHAIEVTKKARWFHIGESPSDCKELIIVLHGYGQSPAYMLSGLHELAQDGRSICAPEGLSKFYVSGFHGRVGASWMTRDDRASEIADHLNYLNKWWNSLDICPSVSVTLIGFSQGVSTAARWLGNGMKVDKVVFYSGTLPPEWTQQKFSLDQQISEIHIVRPNDDALYPIDIHDKDVEGLRLLGYNVMSHKPEGTHKLSSVVIEGIVFEK